MLPEQQQRILGYFIEEARDHLNTIEQGLLNLQDTLNDPEMINEVFRAAHSIKGGAAMLGLGSIQRTAHRLEDCFKVLKENPIKVDQKLESLFLGVSDTLKSLLEHLSGPFGLSEDAASTLMSEAEPVFKWLHEHLESLLGQQGGANITISEPEPEPQPLPKPLPTPTPTNSDNWQQFQNQVLQKLRDMLQLFKQNATPESRKGLEACCQYLAIIGEELNLTNWCHLCRSAASAVVNPDNSYLTLAKIVITDIKQAQELVLAGRDGEIRISQQLETLVGIPEIELLELDFDDNDTTETPDIVDINQVSDNSFIPQTEPVGGSEDNSIEDLITNSELEIPDTADSIDSLFELSEQIDLNLDADVDFILEQGSDNVDSLFELSEQLEAESEFDFTINLETKNNIEPLIEISEQIDDELISINQDNTKIYSIASDDNINSLLEISEQPESDSQVETSITNIVLDPHGPEVGIAELTELDELFKDDAPELDENWEEQETPETLVSSTANTETSNTAVEDTYSEVEDLLVFEDSTSIHERRGNGSEELTVVQLFGTFLDDDDLGSETPKQPEIIDLKSESDTSDVAINPGLVLVQNDDLLGDMFSEQLVAAEFPDFNQASNQDAHLDSLFNDEENSEYVDELSLVDDNNCQSDIAPDADVEFNDLLTTSQSNGHVNLSNDTSQSEDIFDTQFADSPQFSESPTEQVNGFWNHDRETESQLFETENNDVAKALEESLFAAAIEDDFFDNNQGSIATSVSDFDIDDLDIAFEQNESGGLIYSEDGTDDLFEELTPSQIAAVSSPVIEDSEFPNYSQQPESLDFAPEFTQNQFDDVSDDLLPLTTVNNDEFSALAVINDETLQVTFDELENDEILEDIHSSESKIADYPEDNPFAISPPIDFSENLFSVDTIASKNSPIDDNLIDLDLTPSLTQSNNSELDFIDDLFGENTVSQNHTDEDELEAFNNNISAQDFTQELNIETPEIEANQDSVDLQSFDELNSLSVHLEPSIIDAATPEFSEVPPPLFDENSNQLNEVTSNDEDDAADEFAHLEALLGKNHSGETADAIADDEFAALEALLGDQDVPNFPSPIPTSVPNLNVANTTSNLNDEFGDLERLLMDADQSISLSPSTGGNVAKIQRPPARRAARFEQLMKVPVKHLDDMSNLVGELVVNRNTLEQDQERLRQSLDNLLIQVHHLSDVGARMQELYERSLLEASLLASRKNGFGGGNIINSHVADGDRGFSELEMDRFTPFHTLSQEMIELIVRVRESASDIDFVIEETERVARQFRQVTTQLQEGLTRARMVPFSQVTDRVKRGVRDNAIKCGKQVELEIEGQDTLIDKMILEHLTDPLVHMLNNAIAHGIETPEERQAKGKKPVGTINVRAFHQGNQTVISVSDDGAGIDTEGVKQKAIKVGLITPQEASTMPRMEVYELLFQPNFSTKDKADDLAGRGVGMDVVRTSISEIRGTISTDSKLGKGTNFTIRLPLTLSICKALCCVSDKARIAFPMDGVEDTLDIPVKNIQKNAQGESFIAWRDIQLPFKPLKELLTLNRQLSRGSVYGGNRDDDMVSVVVIRSANTLIGLQIDQVLSEQEIVIKQFEGPAPKPIGVAGATVLGDGRIMPIADVLEIIDIFQGRTSKQNAVTIFDSSNNNSTDNTGSKIDPTVLIVDDSITVRELLSLSFNKAGYRVEQARDGQEAWDKLRSGLPCDIVFCDIEMPRCDGLELLSRIQKEPSLNHLPIAMLTSRGADKHKQMAISLGASGYFTKPYLEEALLEAASRMLKGEKLVSTS